MKKNDTLVILSYIPPAGPVEKAPAKAGKNKSATLATLLKLKLLRFMLDWCEMEKQEVRIMLSKTGVNAMASLSGICMADSHPIIAVPALLWFAASAYCLYRRFKHQE